MFASYKDNADNIGIQIAKDDRYISKVKNEYFPFQNILKADNIQIHFHLA